MTIWTAMSAIPSPRELDGLTIPIDAEDFESLCHISFANWLEQRERHDHSFSFGMREDANVADERPSPCQTTTRWGRSASA